MNILIYGTGRLAPHLAKALIFNKHFVQIEGRDELKVSHLRSSLSINAVFGFEGADVIILCVSDSVISEVSTKLAANNIKKNAIVVHCSGATPIDCIDSHFENRGVFWPLQTFNHDETTWQGVPISVDGSNELVKEKLLKMAAHISGNALLANDERRLSLHLAAVFANNFSNHLWTLTEQWCKQHGLKFEYLLPILHTSLEKLSSGVSPAEAQTGPARRHDEVTLERHKSLLQDEPKLLELYELLSYSIQKMYP